MPRLLRTAGTAARFTRCSKSSSTTTTLKASLLARVEPEAGPSTTSTTPRLASILSRASQSSVPAIARSKLSSTFKLTSLLSAPSSSTSVLCFPTSLPSISAATSTTQIRCVTMGSEYQPSQRIRKRRHGFLARRRSKSGRKVLIRRRMKGRRFLSH